MKNCKAIITALLIGACPAVWADSFNTGTNYLGNMTNVTQALIAFSNAVTSAPSDQANVYLALTRVLALPVETTGSNFLNRLQFKRSTNVFDLKLKPTKNSSGGLVVAGNLDADEFTAEIRNDIIPALGASETNLAQITDTTFSLFMPGSVTHFSDVTIDYGDVQMLRALVSTATVFGYTLHTWNLNAQFEAVSNIVAADKSIEAVLSANPGLLVLTNASDLALARSAFTNAVSCYTNASQFIRNRPAGGRFLFNLDMTNANDVNAEKNFRIFIADLESSLGSPFGGTPGALAGAIPGAKFYGAISSFTNHTVSLSNFFAGNFNLRTSLPTLTTNGITFIWDSFTNTTLGGVITGWTVTNLDQAFLKVFHAQAQLSLPGVTCQVVSTVGKNSNLGSLNGVVRGTDGNFYGTTQYGGDNGYGVFFRATPNGGFTPLYSFGQEGPNFNGDELDGMWPSSVVLGGDGNFYGTTQSGGTNDSGTIFKITTSATGATLKTVYPFGDQDDGSISGGNPLMLAKNSSTFYGTTLYGGDNGEGVIFSFTPPSGFGATEGTFTTLASFPSTPQSNPMSYGAGAGALVEGTDGYFYGATQFGGDNGAGSLFQFVPNGTSGVINTGYSFPQMTDAYGNPLTLGINTPVQSASGIFFATTQFGGNIYNSSSGEGDGTLFCIDTNGNFTNLFSFDENGFDGYNPIGALVQGGDGAFYGITSAGGANNDGTIFKYMLGGSPGFVVWFDKGLGEQNGNNGGYNNNTINAGLINVAGEFYGTAPNGGVNGNGTLFNVNGSGLSGNYPPSISTPPASTIAGLGSGAMLTVSAGGSGTLNYQWRKNGSTLNNSGTHITGATSADLTLSGLLLADAGSYAVVVKNSYGSITSAVAVLTVVPPPTLYSQPATPLIVAQGQKLSLSVGASNSVAGGGALTYQWWGHGVSLTDGLGASGETISGSATSNLVINPAFGADSGSYYVVVSNAYAGTNSRVSLATVGVAPHSLVASPPAPTNLVAGSVTFTVASNGTLPLSFHWFKNGTIPLSNGGQVTGATSGSLTLSALTLANSGSYSVVVTNTFGRTTSTVAVLTVVQGPKIITAPPSSLALLQGQELSLKVTASGGNLIYFWRTNYVINNVTNNVDLINGGFVSGAGASNLVINPASITNSGSYTVVVSNSIGAATSGVCVVTVKADTFKPTVAITSPSAGARSNAPVIFHGTASESTSSGGVLITNVNYWITNLNGSPLKTGTALLTAGTGTSTLSNWTASVSPSPGSNVFAVQSHDFSGNTSAVVTVKFFLKSPAQLTVITNTGSGNGRVNGISFISGDTVPANGALLNIGESYAITTMAGTNSYFNGWTGTAGVTNGQTLTFIMENGTTLTANFITNIFVGMAGNYNGLFSSEALGVATAETAGMIGNLGLTSQGGYSGKLYLGGTSYSLASPPSFDHQGNATNVFNTPEGKVTVKMTVNANSSPRTITGFVIGTNNILLSGGTVHPGWQSELSLVASLAKSSNFTRNYTMLIPPPAPATGIVTPPGYGYALLTNDPADANVTLTGMLADGTTLLQPAVPIGEDDTIAVFPPFTGSPLEFLWGKLTLSPSPAAAIPSGNLTWIRKASTSSGMFKAGFTNNSFAVDGSLWSNSVPLDIVVPSGSQFIVTGAGVNTTNVTLVAGTTNFLLNTNIGGSRSVSVNTNTGKFTFVFTTNGVPVTGYGALLQNPYYLGTTNNIGAGFFTMPSTGSNPTNAGSIMLWPPVAPVVPFVAPVGP
jgi:uncharacterized repeat protein (TIGR03803 family)